MNHWRESVPMVRSYFEETFSSDDFPLIFKALNDGTTFSEKTTRGKARFDVSEFDGTMRRVGGRCFIETAYFAAFAFVRAIVTRQFTNGAWTVNVASSDVGTTRALTEFVVEWLEPIPAAPPAPPSVYSFAKEHGSLSIKEIGPVSGEMNRANYTATIVSQFDHVVAQLKHPSPQGRLVLMEGEPGTGKTHMIRAVVCALASACKCILIPSNIIADLSGPEFLQALMNHRRADKTPMVLILEDADDALIARDQNTAAKSSLSGLLNLSDGILGAALDIRVIATTNQKFDNLDRAVLRPGRLLQRMSVGALSPDEASACFAALTGRTRAYDAPTTLAQVYEHTAEGT